jgi:hypothetical protein
MDMPERGTIDNRNSRNVIRGVTGSSFPDSALELDALFDQSPIALIFRDHARRRLPVFRHLLDARSFTAQGIAEAAKAGVASLTVSGIGLSG